MNQLVFIENGQVVTDSLKVAETFGKRHADVMRDIRSIECSEEFNQRNFAQVKYSDESHRTYPKVNMTRDGFVFLVMGFTGKKASGFKEDYIKAFNHLENTVKNPEIPSYMIDNPVQRAEKWIEEHKEKQFLLVSNNKKDQIIGELKPKADYADLILQNKGLVNIVQIAKDYGMSAQVMNKHLHELKVQYKSTGQWLLYRNYQDKGYTHSSTANFKRSDGRPDVKMNTKWTQKGRLFIYNLLKSQGIIPVIEREGDPTG